MQKPLLTCTLVVLVIVLAACDSEPHVSDAERMEEIGARLGGPWPMDPDCPSALAPGLEVLSETAATSGSSGGILLGYNAHEELQAGFDMAGGWGLATDERDLDTVGWLSGAMITPIGLQTPRLRLRATRTSCDDRVSTRK